MLNKSGPKVRVKVKTSPGSDAAQGRPTKAEQRAIDRNARQVKRRVDAKRAAARRKNFPDAAHIIPSINKSTKESIKGLALLRAQDPKAYARREKESHKSGLSKALDTAAVVTHPEAALIKFGAKKVVKPAAQFTEKKVIEPSAKALKKAIDAIPETKQQRAQRTMGFDPGKERAKEAIDIIANTPTSLYLTGAAGFEAAQGRPKRAKKLAKDFTKSSALAPAAEAIARNVQGKGAGKQWREAAKRANERPLTTALELSGAKAVVGRGLGAGLRAAPSKTLRKIGSTERPNLRLDPSAKPGEGPEVRRTYSRDVINKQLQVAVEKSARRAGRDPNVDTGGLNKIPVRRTKLEGRADTRAFSQTRRERQHRREAVKKTQRALRKRQAAGVQAVAEGTARGVDIKTLRTDLRKRRLALAKARVKLTDPERIKLNRAEAAHIRKLENLSDEKLARSVPGAQEFVSQQTEVQARGRRTGAFDETGQSKRFFPALQSHIKRPAGEQRVVGVPEGAGVERVIERRIRKGQAVPPRMAERIQKSALTRQPEAPRLAHSPDPRTVNAEFKRAGGKLPIVVRPMRGPATKTGRRGSYAGIQTDNLTGQRYHLIAYNPKHGIGAINYAVRFEMGRALRHERTGEFKPTTKMHDAEYYNTGGYRSAKAYADKHADISLFEPPSLEALVSRGRGNLPGSPRLLHRSDITKAVARVRRRERVPGRALNQEELAATARVLQRRSRRGRATLEGLPEGGPALITQRPGVGTGRRGSFPAPTSPSKERSGTAFAEGSRDVGERALMRQSVLAEQTATAMEGFQLIDREFGRPATRNGQRYADSFAESMETAHHLFDETGMLYRPVNIAAFRDFGARLRRRQEEGMPRTAGREWENHISDQASAETWHLATQESGRGKWVLMPAEIVDRFAAHAGVNTRGVLHGATNLFKDVVLTTSSPSRWLGSNIVDLTMRTVFEGITPNDIVRGARIVRNAYQRGPQGEQAVGAVAGGGFYHASEALNRAVGARGVNEHLARTVLAAPWRGWKGLVYALEGGFETLPQYGALGKSMRRATGRTFMRRPIADDILSNGGITVNLAGKEPRVGFGVATHPERERVIPAKDLTEADVENFVASNIDLLKRPGNHIGAWVDGDNVHFDISTVVKSREGAVAKARAADQEAIFDLGAMEEISTGLPASARGPVRLLREDPPSLAQRAADMRMRTNLKTLLKLHDRQIDNYARQLATDRALEAQIQKATEDVIGRWGKISPGLRRALVVAPFVQWLGAATRYVYVTLPVHHPIKTGILAGISEMTDEERQKLGLSYYLPRDKQVYDYQMGALPLHVGHNKYGPTVSGIRTARATSFGTAAGVPGNIGEFLFPQFAGALDAWAGTSFTHEQLVYPDWWPEVSKRRTPMPPDELQAVGLGALLEAGLPFLSAFRRTILEKGRPSEPYSTILTPATRKKWNKEDGQFEESKGTALGGILEWLSPYAPEGRLYTYGAGKSIEENAITGETLDKWRKQPKLRKSNDPFGFGGGAPRNVPQTQADPYGFTGKPTKKETKSNNPYGF